MPLAVSIVELLDRFPDFRVAVVVAEAITVSPARPPLLEALIAERVAQARERWAGQELADVPGIAVWRKAYRAFGVKQTRYRWPWNGSSRTCSPAARSPG